MHLSLEPSALGPDTNLFAIIPSAMSCATITSTDGAFVF